MNICKYSALYLSIFVTSFFIISCNQSDKTSVSQNYIQSNSGSVSIYTSEENETTLVNFIQTNASKNKHLPLDDQFETILNYYISAPKSKEEIRINERILVFFNTDIYDEISSEFEIPFENNFNAKLYENVWGLGQKVMVIDAKQDLDEWLKSNFANFENALIQINQNLGLSGVEGYFPKLKIAQRKYADSVENLLLKNYGFTIDIPNNFRIVQSDSQFVWITNIQKENGFESIMINIFNENLNYSKISSLIENRNRFTHQYIHNDEGTQISVSESGAYNPILDLTSYTNINNQNYHQLLGWYTELGTYRRGPFGRYYYQGNANKTIAIDWFCGGKPTYNISESKLSSIAKSFRLKQ